MAADVIGAQTLNLASTCQRRDWDLATKLIQDGADVNEQDSNDNLPMHWACWHGGANVVDALLAKKAALDKPNCIGELPIHFASKAERLACVSRLVHHDPLQVAIPDEDGFTPMHHAAQKDLIGSLEWLFLHGAPVDVHDRYGFTPLHWAVYNGQFRAVQWLIAAGCSEAAPDNEGCTMLHWIAIKNRPRIWGMLLRVWPQLMSRSALHTATDKRDRKMPYQLARHHNNRCLAMDLWCTYRALTRKRGALIPDSLRQFPVVLYGLLNLLNLWVVLTFVLPELHHARVLVAPATLVPCVFFVIQAFSFTEWYQTLHNEPGYVTQAKAIRGERDSLAEQAIRRGLHAKGLLNGGRAPTYEADEELAAKGTKVWEEEALRAVEELCRARQSPCSAPYLEILQVQTARACTADATGPGRGKWMQQVCVICGVYRDKRTKHCKDCGRCVVNFDHHCPWVHNCVGRDNVGHFFRFVFSLFFALLFVEGMSVWVYMATNVVDERPIAFFIILGNAVLDILWIFFAGCLCGRQAVLAAGDVTEWEVMTEPQYIKERMKNRAGCVWFLRDRTWWQLCSGACAQLFRGYKTPCTTRRDNGKGSVLQTELQHLKHMV